MASDFTLAFQEQKPIKTIATVSNTNWLLVNIPNSTKRITVGCKTQSLFLSFSYSDGDPKNTIDSTWIPSNDLYNQTIPNNIASFQVVADLAPASVVVVVLEDS